jgi:hypothetical protein
MALFELKPYPVPEPKRKTCDHEWILKIYVKSNGLEVVCYECTICFKCDDRKLGYKKAKKEWNLSDDEICSLGVRNKEMRNRWYHERMHDGSQAWWEWYQGYLNSPEWNTRRMAVLARDGGMCQAKCGRKATQVHHLSYMEVGNEPLEDLASVCEDCHKMIHRREL